VITSIARADDPRLDDFRSLREKGARRKGETPGGPEAPAGFFIVEGWEPVRRLISSDWEIRSVLVVENKAKRLEPANLEFGAFESHSRARFSIYSASKEVLNDVVGFDLHRGVIASAQRRPQLLDWQEVAAGAARLAILEGINDAENLGAVFRSAEVLGIEGVLMDPSVPDPLYRRTVRVSMGAAFLIPFAWMTRWPAGLSDLKAMGFTLLAMAPDSNAPRIQDIAVPARPAILLGSEADGLSEAALALADVKVQIGQVGGLDSLNVGHAAAIAFHRFGGI